MTVEKAVSDGPELLNCVLLGLNGRLLLSRSGGGRAVELVVQDVEVRLWNEVFNIFLPEFNIAAKRRLTQTVGEAGVAVGGAPKWLTDKAGFKNVYSIH